MSGKDGEHKGLDVVVKPNATEDEQPAIKATPRSAIMEDTSHNSDISVIVVPATLDQGLHRPYSVLSA